MNWQAGIATAPRDGSPVLLWLAYPDAILPSDEGPVVARWNETGWWLSRDGETAYPERFIKAWCAVTAPEGST